MNHNDDVVDLPEGFACIAHTDNCRCGAVADDVRKYYGVQFHPEVAHTQKRKPDIAKFSKKHLRMRMRLESGKRHRRDDCGYKEQGGKRTRAVRA